MLRLGGYHELAEVALLTAEAVEEIESSCEVLRAPREEFRVGNGCRSLPG